MALYKYSAFPFLSSQISNLNCNNNNNNNNNIHICIAPYGRNFRETTFGIGFSRANCPRCHPNNNVKNTKHRLQSGKLTHRSSFTHHWTPDRRALLLLCQLPVASSHSSDLWKRDNAKTSYQCRPNATQ